MYIEPFFRWYDLWVGAYVDRENRAIYICPIPMIGIKISFTPRKKKSSYRLSGELRPESYNVGDRVKFLVDSSKHHTNNGKFGIVTKKYMKPIGWIAIEVACEDGTAHTFEWSSIHIIRKVIPVTIYVELED